MIKQCLNAAILATALCACGANEQSTTPPDVTAASTVIGSATLAGIDSYVQAQMSKQRIPGLTLLVASNGTPILQKGYGLANIERQQAATPDTIYHIGSITKQFAAAGIMLLVQDGKLSLDQQIAPLFPTAPASWNGITVRQLLQHTAGFPRDFQQQLAPLYDPQHHYTLDELISLMGTIPLDAPPGAVHSYSNMGYFMAGMVIEKVSGQPYFDFLQRRIFRPLGMNTAALVTAPSTPGTEASGYLWDNGWQPENALFPGDDDAAGGLRMSAPDLARWDAALYGERILTRQSREFMWAPAVLNDGSTVQYGMGWVPGTINGHPYIWHNGQVQGFHTQFERHYREGLTVIVLTNQGEALPERISAGIVARINPALAWQTVPDPRPQVGMLARSLVDDVINHSFHPERYTATEAARLAGGAFDAYASMAASFGALEQFGLVDSRSDNGVTTYRYLLKSHDDSALLLLQLDAGGKVGAMYFN
ncbi:MAG TPA: serine hydrolase domain-containing protein [Burkholderiaceae bacterium]|nr:serine hydrolase domain-containing protein [Burkholderiaceae bacterium]